MENLIKELEKLNKVIADVNSTMSAILEDLKKVEVMPTFGNDEDNHNGDSNFEREQ